MYLGMSSVTFFCAITGPIGVDTLTFQKLFRAGKLFSSLPINYPAGTGCCISKA